MAKSQATTLCACVLWMSVCVCVCLYNMTQCNRENYIMYVVFHSKFAESCRGTIKLGGSPIEILAGKRGSHLFPACGLLGGIWWATVGNWGAPYAEGLILWSLTRSEEAAPLWLPPTPSFPVNREMRNYAGLDMSPFHSRTMCEPPPPPVPGSLYQWVGGGKGLWKGGMRPINGLSFHEMWLTIFTEYG